MVVEAAAATATPQLSVVVVAAAAMTKSLGPRNSATAPPIFLSVQMKLSERDPTQNLQKNARNNKPKPLWEATLIVEEFP